VSDLVLLGILTAAAFLAAVLRFRLRAAQGSPLKGFWRFQNFLFPLLLLLAALALYLARLENLVLPVVVIGLLVGLLFSILRRKHANAPER